MNGSPKTCRCQSNIPPPVFIRDKSVWANVNKTCETLKMKFILTNDGYDSIFIQPSSEDEFQLLIKILGTKGVDYYTHSPVKEKHMLRIIIKNVPASLTTTYIKEDLLSQSFPVCSVVRMGSRLLQGPCEIVYVTLHNSYIAKTIFNSLSVLCGISNITVEHPYKGGINSQCQHCHLFGHTVENCFANPTIEYNCNRDKDISPSFSTVGLPDNGQDSEKSSSKKSAAKKLIKSSIKTLLPVITATSNLFPPTAAKELSSVHAPIPVSQASSVLDKKALKRLEILDKIDINEFSLLVNKLLAANEFEGRFMALWEHMDLIKTLNNFD